MMSKFWMKTKMELILDIWYWGMDDVDYKVLMAKIKLCVTKVDAELEIKAYYAGHVLGAAMFQVK